MTGTYCFEKPLMSTRPKLAGSKSTQNKSSVVWMKMKIISNGIKCHVCNSKEDIKCMDPFNVSSTLQECVQDWFGGAGGKTFDVIEIIMQNLDSGGNNGAEQKTASASVDDKPNKVMVCQKIVVIVGEETITSRGCSPKLVDGMHPCDAVKLSTPERTVQLRQCFTCSRDACNAVTGVVLSPGLLTGLALFASLLCHIKGH
ncbi:hypothetical protein CBL_09153 [Carabus blaptoides fortunei]